MLDAGRAGLLQMLFASLCAILAVLRSGDPATRAAFEKALRALRDGKYTGFEVVVHWLSVLSIPTRNRLDVAQDVMVRAIRSWRSFDANYGREPGAAAVIEPEPVHFSRWLNKIAVRGAADYHRTKLRRWDVPRHDQSLEQIPADNGSPDARLIRRASRCELAAALLCLPAAYRRAALQHVERLAKRSGTPVSTIYKMRESGRGALRTLLLLNNPIVARRGRIAQIGEARRLLRKYGLSENDARRLLDRADVTSHPATLLSLIRRAKAHRLSGEAHGPLHLAAQASPGLMDLAVDAAAAGLFVLARPFRAPRLP